MKLYGIGGLGADKRVFEFLKLNCEFIPIEWIKPLFDETIENYSKRLSTVIDINSEFGILGVSFGGLIAVEISKLLSPKLTILISSAETKNDLRPIYRLIGKTGMTKLLPQRIFNPPKSIAHFIFGTKNKELLNGILDDTDLEFAKWAVIKLTTWENEKKVKPILKISGSNDKLLPPNEDENTVLVNQGEHFMIVDKADEISSIINSFTNLR